MPFYLLPEKYDTLRARLFPHQPAGHAFHYASVSAMQKIVASKRLWLTHVRYLSDEAETTHALSRLRELARQRSAALEESLGFLHHYPFFTGSLSANGNLLSQWRAYCPNNDGTSLGYITAELARAARRQGCHFGPCIYDDAERDRVLTALLDCLESTPDRFQEHTTSWDIVSVCLLMKHRAFSEEAEWRIVAPHSPGTRPVLYRPGRSLLIPYVEFELPDIKKAWVGPTRHPDVALKSIRDFLGTSVAGHCESCDIPIRAAV